MFPFYGVLDNLTYPFNGGVFQIIRDPER